MGTSLDRLLHRWAGMNGGTSLVVHWLRILLARFPGGSVVKNPAANAGDTGSVPGPGRSHMPRGN